MIKHSIVKTPLDKKTDCLLLAIFADSEAGKDSQGKTASSKQSKGVKQAGPQTRPVKALPLNSNAAAIDKALNGAIQALIDSGEATAEAGSTCVLRTAGLNSTATDDSSKNLPAKIILIGAGAVESLTVQAYAKVAKAAAEAVLESRAQTITDSVADSVAAALGDHATYDDRTLSLNHGDSTRIDAPACFSQSLLAYENAAYRFEHYKTVSAGKPPVLAKVQFVAGGNESGAPQQAIEHASALAHGMKLTRDLGNSPGNVCTPRYLAEQAEELAKEHAHISCEILDEKAIKKLGMGAFLSVSKGSDEPPRLIAMSYMGAGKSGSKTAEAHVLVGKGITFDTGGISLKAGANMDEMKYDMCGAASVFGVMKALAELKPAINVVGVVAAAENMPSARASKPGDIVTTMSGQTVEIMNTDAEGRLVLCDTLSWIEKFKPASVIDIATLTGACIVALGHDTSALISTDDDLAHALLAAGQRTGDRSWRLPLWDVYQPQIDSPFADIQNIGQKGAGTITAACFLSRFTKSYKWAHLDVAGTAWVSGPKRSATGRPVPQLLSYLLAQA